MMKWVERRKNLAPLKFRSAGYIKGKVIDANGRPLEFKQRLDFIDKDGMKHVVCSVPKDFLRAELYLPVSRNVVYPYKDEDRESVPGFVVPMDNLNKEIERIIYVDDR